MPEAALRNFGSTRATFPATLKVHDSVTHLMCLQSTHNGGGKVGQGDETIVLGSLGPVESLSDGWGQLGLFRLVLLRVLETVSSSAMKGVRFY